MRPGVRAVQVRGSDNSADFSRRERSDSFWRSWRADLNADLNQGSVQWPWVLSSGDWASLPRMSLSPSLAPSCSAYS